MKRPLIILVACRYKHSQIKTTEVPEGEIVRFGKHFLGARKLRLIGIESGRNTTSFEVVERQMSRTQYSRIIGSHEEAEVLLRAAASFETGDILTRRGMVFERIARSFRPGKTFDLDISGFTAKYGHL